MPMIDWEVEKSILERIRAGDTSACDECIELHYDGLYRLALRMLQDPLEAEDAVQETFLNAFKAIHKFDGRSRLGTWLFRITYNTSLMQLRKQKMTVVSITDLTKFRENAADDDTPDILDLCCLPESDFLRSEALAEIERAVDELSDALRDVFWLREIEGYSTAETAKQLGVSQSAVKVRLHRARRILRGHLKKYFGERGILKAKPHNA